MRRPITHKVQNLHGKYASICGRHECESKAHYPGRPLNLLSKTEILSSRGDKKEIEESAEVIVVPIKGNEGRNLNLGKKEFIHRRGKKIIEKKEEILEAHRGSITRNVRGNL